MGDMINWTIFLRSLKARCYGNRFVAQIADLWRKSAKIGTSPASFCALAFQNGGEDRNIVTWMHALHR